MSCPLPAGLYKMSFRKEGVLLSGSSKVGLIRYKEISRWTRLPGEEVIETSKFTIRINSCVTNPTRERLDLAMKYVSKRTSVFV